MAQGSSSLVDRMVGAAFLNIDTFEQVEHDKEATLQAAGVVVIVTVCEALGSWSFGPIGALWAAATAVVAWLVWAGITYLIGEKIFDGEATWGELLRTLGFAQAPGVLYLLGVLPLAGGLISLVVSIWIMIAGFIAIRQALDIGNAKTFLTILVGGGVYAFLHVFPFPF